MFDIDLIVDIAYEDLIEEVNNKIVTTHPEIDILLEEHAYE